MVPMTRLSALLLIALPLGAAPPDLRLDLRMALGADSAKEITLVPQGIWDGLLLAARGPARPSANRRGLPEATVEVSDFFLPTSPRTESFQTYVQNLRERLLRGFKAPPPSHGAIDLSEFMESDPAHPGELDSTRARTLQDRFNRLPPNGSPVELK